jgi:hypothetical protein
MARFLKYGVYAWLVCYAAIAYTLVLKFFFPGPSASLAYFGILMPIEVGFYFLFASLALDLSALFEILPSKNGIGYKVLWAAAVLLLSEIGVLAYYFIGRKDLIDENEGKKAKQRGRN